MEHIGTIDEKTKVPLRMVGALIGLAGSILLLVVGVAISYTKLEAKVDGHEVDDDKRVEDIQRKQEETQRLFYSIDSRLSRIEGQLTEMQRRR